jgi:glycerophosphoryl diester phosphodiesterase
MKKAIKVQGHRGSRGTHPENTLPAFIEAIEAQAAGIELDLRVTKDGAVIICDYELAELKQLRYGFATDPEFPRQKALPGTEIPTLEELFVMLEARQDPYGKALKINLEMKRDRPPLDRSIDPALFADQVVSLVERFQFKHRVYYSSFAPILLEKVRLRNPRATLGYIVDSIDFTELLHDHALVKKAHALGATILSPEYPVLNREIVQTLHNSSLRVIPWTVNDPRHWRALIEMGVDEIITDYPRQLVEFLSAD